MNLIKRNIYKNILFLNVIEILINTMMNLLKSTFNYRFIF